MRDNPPATLDELKALLRYDTATGLFYWLVTSRRAKAGAIAGSLDDTGSIVISINGIRTKAHRLAWFYHYGVWPVALVDHKDLTRSHNAIGNLRLATYQQNAANSKQRGSAQKGVRKLAEGKYRASITVGGKRLYLGQFQTEDRAGEAYRLAAETHFGEFARCR